MAASLMDNGHDWKLKKKRSDTSLHHYFFSERVKKLVKQSAKFNSLCNIGQQF